MNLQDYVMAEDEIALEETRIASFCYSVVNKETGAVVSKRPLTYDQAATMIFDLNLWINDKCEIKVI